jgi:CheY-like chemotaxis protein
MHLSIMETLGSGPASAAPLGTAPATSFRQRTVLLVDDDGEFRHALADALRAEGHDVIDVRSGEAALAVLDHAADTRARPPDLVVLDLLMPGIGGVEVVRRLRKSAWAETPVVVVTGVNDPMLPVRLDLPVAFKPDVDAILKTIHRYLVPQDFLVPAAAVSPHQIGCRDA